MFQKRKKVKVHIFEFAGSFPFEGFGADFLEDVLLSRREVKESCLGALHKSRLVLLRRGVEHEHGNENGDYYSQPNTFCRHR